MARRRVDTVEAGGAAYSGPKLHTKKVSPDCFSSQIKSFNSKIGLSITKNYSSAKQCQADQANQANGHLWLGLLQNSIAELGLLGLLLTKPIYQAKPISLFFGKYGKHRIFWNKVPLVV
jgi:hypothetical protein